MSTLQPAKPSPLEPSKLGTKEYWDRLYSTEIANHALDPSDEGTVWFDDSSAEDKLLSFFHEEVCEKRVLGNGITRRNCSFLDLGTGNGHLLFRLREPGEEGDDCKERGWDGRMLGVDYSEQSIELAKRVAEGRGFCQEREIEFKWWDLMREDPAGVVLEGHNAKGWDVVLDKGTFDAISLSDAEDDHGRRICEGYKEKVVSLVRHGGLFLVTSCNWTGDELRSWFEGGELQYLETIKYKSFHFGGQQGQTISSICFRRLDTP